MRILFSLCLSLVLSAVCLGGEPLMFSKWGVMRADDGSSVAAVTMVNEQAGFGEWCFFKSQSCTWELLINIECKEGAEHLIFANSTSSYASLTVSCYGRGGPIFSDTGISGFLAGHDRREVHAKAETEPFCEVQGASGA